MPLKKNDFDQDSYVQKVDSATEKLEKVENRLKKIEELTDATLLCKVFEGDVKLREAFGKLIWQTIKDKAWQAFLYVFLACLILPILSKLVSLLFLKVFNVNLNG